jgi:hypothetical protein
LQSIGKASRQETAMCDDPRSFTTLARPPRDSDRSSRQEANRRPRTDDLFYGAGQPPRARDAAAADRCRPLTLAALIAAAILSAALTASIGLHGAGARRHAAPSPPSDASHARFGPVHP